MSVVGSKYAKSLFLSIVVLLMIGNNAFGAEEKQSYPEVGITKSLLIRPSLGYWWNRTGVRLTGMYLNNDTHEFQFNFGYAFYDTVKLQQSVSLVTCWVVGSDPGADYRYGATGLSYSINYRGFFFELGLVKPWRDDIGNLENDFVVPCMNWGYIYRFCSD